MRRHLTRTVAALAAAATVGALAIALPPAASAADAPEVRITEWMYSPASGVGEFFELANLGSAPVALAGWSFSDSARTPGAVPLDGLGTLAAGESAIVTDATDAAFRAEWGLGSEVKILAGNTVGLGRSDEINLYDGTDATQPVDRLTYDDQGSGAVKGPRTQGVSGIPSTASALGAVDASQWRLSAAGDDESSWTSTAGNVGSPGRSRFAPAGTAPAWASIRINEVSSDNGDTPVGDAVELFNGGDADVSIAGWLQADSSGPTAAKTFSAFLADGSPTTVVPAHGYVYFASTKGLGSGGDSVGLYLPDGVDGAAGTVVDSVDYTAGEAGADEANGFGAGAFARCGDGTGAFVSVKDKSFGASNADACRTVLANPADGDGGGTPLACEPEAPSGTGTLPSSAVAPAAWPGSAQVTAADAQCAWTTATGPEGRDVSGLVFDPSDPDVLYSVKNKSWVFRMVKDGSGLWVPDTANGWGAGKQIFFPGSIDTATNQPDSEGLTIGPDGALYVTTERNNASNTNPLDSILRFDPASSAPQLVATDQWDLTAEFPELHAGNKTEANLGFEGVSFVPDSYLTANGFVDQSTGATYRPSDYPLHGTGLYFAALENDGKLYAYALNSDHSFHRVAVVDTGMGHVMDVQFDAATQRIWALCDNTCGVVSTLLKVSATGAIVPDVAFAGPAGLPVNNLEGFALAPASTCVDGTREVVWSDDGIYGTGPGSATEGHALFSGRLSCELALSGQGVPPAAPALTLSVGSARAGDRVTVTGAHFAPGASVAFVFNSAPVALGTATAASDGTLTFAFAVPQVPAGAHTVTASVGGTVLASAAITVTAPSGGAAAGGGSATAGDRAGALASTGSDIGGTALLGALALLALGGGLLWTRRRKAGVAGE